MNHHESSWIIMNHHESSWIISDHVVKRFTKMSTEVVERWWLHDKSKVGWCRGHFTPVWQCQWDSQRFILFISFISLLFNVPVAVHCIYIYILHYIIIILHIWDIYWICIWNIIYIYSMVRIWWSTIIVHGKLDHLWVAWWPLGYPSDLSFLRWSTFGRTLSTFALQSVV